MSVDRPCARCGHPSSLHRHDDGLASLECHGDDGGHICAHFRCLWPWDGTTGSPDVECRCPNHIEVDTLTSATLTVRAPDNLLTVNRERTLNHHVRADIVRAWRRAAMVRANEQRIPPFAWVELTVRLTQARGVLADAGSHYPVVKAIVDGLVDAGVLADDGPEYVRRIDQHPPTRDRSEVVTVVLRGEAAP